MNLSNQIFSAYEKLNQRYGKALTWVLIALVGIGVVILPFIGDTIFPGIKFAQQAFWVRVIGYTMLYIVLGLGLNIVVGFAGLLDLGYVAFYAIGAYTYGLLASGHFGIHLSFWLVAPIAALLASFTGVLLGIPVLRMRGDYLAIVTLGFGEIIRILLNNLRGLTNGSQGLVGIDRPTIYWFELMEKGNLASLKFVPIELKSGTQYYFLIFILVIVVLFISNRLNHSRIGRAWIAMREDEDVADMTGINTTLYKLMAFATGAFIGGLCGSIFAAWQGSIFPDNFNLFVSINVLSLIIIGGIGSLPGVVVGALALIALPDFLRKFSDYRIMMYGLLLVIMMIARPEGFIPSKRRQMEMHGDRNEPAASEAGSD